MRCFRTSMKTVLLLCFSAIMTRSDYNYSRASLLIKYFAGCASHQIRTEFCFFSAFFGLHGSESGKNIRDNGFPACITILTCTFTALGIFLW